LKAPLGTVRAISKAIHLIFADTVQTAAKDGHLIFISTPFLI
jgi:hypothetical protein